MQIPSPRPSRRARIEIIPLIDIIFFLLATFVMVSLSMVKNQGISVHLPIATSGSEQDRTMHLSLSVNERGEYFFDKKLVSLNELIAKLSQAKMSNPDLKVFINGDANAKFQGIVTILDETRKLGITKVAIETTKG